MNFQETNLKGSYLINLNKKEDKRGFLNRIFCKKILKPILKNKNITQINHTLTKKVGSIRGLHFQYHPHAEIKIVNCFKGKIWDVAVDLRKKSPTFLHYHSEILSDKNLKSFFIPEGFAHGFQTLTPHCEILYFHTANYNLNYEGTINPLDPRISIKWPKPISEMSKKDRNQSDLDENFLGIKI
jgi:dTDP-4-dehydrorhamnose 3,5-epimerase